MAPWLEKALDDASQRHFGKPAMYMGEGGTIPFMYMLGEKFPKAQFCITGVLGPGSNAHGPNEFLHIPTARKLTLCVADVLATHAQAVGDKVTAMSTRPPKATYDLVLLPGDGIGVEVIADARALLEAMAPKLGVTFGLTEIPCGGKYYLEHGSRDWPEGAEERCRAADAILLGAVGWNGPDGQPVTMPDGKMAGWSPVIGNRMRLDLYANVRPVRCLPGTKHGIRGQFSPVWQPENVDMVIIRENTEGLYSGIGERDADARDRRPRDHAARLRARDPQRVRAVAPARQAARPATARSASPASSSTTCCRAAGCSSRCSARSRKDFPDIEHDVAIVDCVRDVRADAARALRRVRHDEHVRRHPHRPRVACCRAAWAWPSAATSATTTRCSSRSTARRRRSPARIARTRWRCCSRPARRSAWLGHRHGDERLTRGHAAIEAAVASIVARGEPLTSDLGGSAGRAAVAAAVQHETLSRL